MSDLGLAWHILYYGKLIDESVVQCLVMIFPFYFHRLLRHLVVAYEKEQTVESFSPSIYLEPEFFYVAVGLVITL